MTAKNTMACPSWCDDRHARNELLVGDYVHVQRTDELRGATVTIEQMVLCEGQSTDGVPIVTIRTDHLDTEVSSSDARQYAAALLNAADELDRINAAVA